MHVYAKIYIHFFFRIYIYKQWYMELYHQITIRQLHSNEDSTKV